MFDLLLQEGHLLLRLKACISTGTLCLGWDTCCLLAITRQLRDLQQGNDISSQLAPSCQGEAQLHEPSWQPQYT